MAGREGGAKATGERDSHTRYHAESRSTVSQRESVDRLNVEGRGASGEESKGSSQREHRPEGGSHTRYHAEDNPTGPTVSLDSTADGVCRVHDCENRPRNQRILKPFSSCIRSWGKVPSKGKRTLRPLGDGIIRSAYRLGMTHQYPVGSLSRGCYRRTMLHDT